MEAAEDTMGAEETEDTGGQTPQGPRSPQPGPSTSGGQGPQGHSVVTSIGSGVSHDQSPIIVQYSGHLTSIFQSEPRIRSGEEQSWQETALERSRLQRH